MHQEHCVRGSVQMRGNLMLSLSVKTVCDIVIGFLKCVMKLKVYLKGIAKKRTILSLITHPHFIPSFIFRTEIKDSGKTVHVESVVQL